ncbi:MAG: S-layer homology domain-containing protein, partial [Oscillospiraceae bacterium]|nr:S-layer homology domain-containing protein [Oscillospiraceae bacterium]
PTAALAANNTVSVDGTEYYSEAYKVLQLINEARNQEGLSSLTMGKALLDTAMLRSAEQSVYASHTRPDGSDCFTAFTVNGSRGENIAAGQLSAAEVMEDWMNSPGHRSNILNANYSSVGVGCFEHNGVKYWTQCFSSERASAHTKPADREITADVSIGAQVYFFTIGGTEHMNAGDTQNLKVTQSNPGFSWATTRLNPAGLEWFSTDPTVASVNKGVVTAVSAGTAVISFEVGRIYEEITITVTGKAEHTHTMVYVAGKAPTYTENGIMAHWHCTVCGRYYMDQKAYAEIGIEDINLPKLVCTSHVWDSGIITSAPTSTQTGIKTFTCTQCGATKTETVPVNDQVTMMHSGDLNAAKPTQAQLSAKWAAVTSASSFFAETPSTTAPYSKGELSEQLLDSGLTHLNFMRFAAGLPSVQLSDELNESAQYGAVVLAANDVLSHYPTQPADMDELFFNRGADATSKSNISMRFGFSNYNPLQSSTQGCMDDSSSASNLACLGHRRWLLNPTLLNVGFGYAQAESGADYIATRVFDRSGSAIDYDFIAWPASGNFPNNVFSNNTPWSVSLNQSDYKKPVLENLTITLTRVSDNKVWTFNGSGETTGADGKYITVDTNGYGIGNCIIFRPTISDIGTYNGSYTVRIEGLQTKSGNAAELNYQVDFFTISTCSHRSETIPAVAPTCEEEGLTEGAKCALCGTILKAQMPVPPAGHKEVVAPAVAPTCEEDGREEGKRCEVCQKILVTQKLIPALGHDYESKVITPATCAEEGAMLYTCKNDKNHTYTEAIPKTDHTDNNDDGHCDVCNILTCTNHQPILVPEVPATCEEDGITQGTKCSICGTPVSGMKVIPALGHKEVIDDEVLPTCEETGLSEGSHCDRCGKVFNEQTVLPATGHTEVSDEAKAATCTETGLTAGKHCEVCGKVLQKQQTTPALDHDFVDGFCSRCNEADPNPDSDCYNGTCGENLTWHIDITDWTLTIRGTGAMDDFDTTPAGWHAFMNCITDITIEEGVTSVGACAFINSSTLKVVHLPSTLESIGKRSFTACPNITDVYYEGSASEFKALFAPEHWGQFYDHVVFHYAKVDPTPTPTVEPTPTPTVVPTPTPTAKPTPTPTAKPTPTPTAKPTPTPVPVENPFKDVSEQDWYYNPVMWAKENEVTGGKTADTFAPNESCTRAQVVTFLWAAAGKPEPKSSVNPFDDVADDAWYLKPVLWAVENGITSGISKREFGPEQTCTRAQVVTFLYASAGKPAPTSSNIPFTDVSAADWFVNPVLWAVENHITGGIGNNMFGPNDTCTRAQVVTFLYKASQLKK